MIIFNSDLDNTLIYSYKRDIGGDKKCVEIYQGREVSFMSRKSYEELKNVQQKVLFVPTTTRTEEQYKRIDLGIGTPAYALVCNGGVLLEHGVENEEWYRESLALVSDCQRELEKAEEILEQDPHRSLEVRNIRNLFIFTKSEKPERSVEALKQVLDHSLVEVFRNGIKVYVVPRTLSKGNAVRRLCKKLRGEYVIAAGDSAFDVPMLQEADVAIIPKMLANNDFSGRMVLEVEDSELFSDRMLAHVLEIEKRIQKMVNY